MAKKKIIIIDDEPLIPQLLKEVLEEDPDLELAAVTSKKEEFLELVHKQPFDGALVDLSIGEREGGLDLLRELKSSGIDLPCVVLSAHDEVDYALKSLMAGAKGYVNKGAICQDLIPGLKEVLQDNLFVSGSNGKYVLRKYHQLSDPSDSSV